MNKILVKISKLILLVFSITIVACQPKGDRFTIEGQLAEAYGKKLYLEKLGLDGVEVVDSVILDQEGLFEFKESADTSCFEFYRLKIDNQEAILAIDSTETVHFEASLPVMNVAYQVSGSEDCKLMRDLIMVQIEIQQEIKRAYNKYGEVAADELNLKIIELFEDYRNRIKEEFVIAHTDKPCAYYALFLNVNGDMIFHPQTDRQDAKCYAAVASSMEMNYPNAVRTQHLKNMALKCMQFTTPLTPASDDVVKHFESIISETGIIDIELPDLNNKMHRLSDLKGSVVLLDFTAFKTDYSPKYNMFLRELYNKYADKGFQIYQVSVDTDAHFWMTSAKNLPWICVRDEKNIESAFVSSYYVRALPTAFLIDRNNDVVERLENIDGLGDKIEKLLSNQK